MTAANRILIVDDDSDLLSGLVRQLGARFDIVTAESGEEALRQVHLGQPFAVVLSDVRMPGMGGIKLLERLKELAPETVRLVLTGHADQQATADAINRASVFHFLNKPISTPQLIEAIDSAVSHYRQVMAERALAAAQKKIEEQNQILADRERELEETVCELRVYQEELRAQNEELLRSRSDLEKISARYRDVFDISTFGIFLIDECFSVISANNAALLLLGNPDKSLTQNSMFGEKRG